MENGKCYHNMKQQDTILWGFFYDSYGYFAILADPRGQTAWAEKVSWDMIGDEGRGLMIASDIADCVLDYCKL